ncbi:MAG: NAD(P)/FAD-dependent oxidoreductase [Clostridia bacterium]|nr:NAD(P)/FAD-dependent oxidoreductase [Clostridia bacterium]
MFQVVVIGGGVVGALILRELTKYNLSCCMLEAQNDVAMGQSRANSGIVHAGFDAKEGSLKAKFNVLGSRMMQSVTEQLGVKYINNGSLVVAFSQEEAQLIYQLKERGEANGVKNLSILSRDELLEKEKNISENAVCALYAPTGAIVCPYELTIAAIGNAMDNGAALYTNFKVSKIESEGGVFTLISENGNRVQANVVVNCAGYSSDKIANMIGDYSFKMGARRGEYILLDRESGDLVSHTMFFTPTKLGKGILVTPTVDGNILLGPTAVEQTDNCTYTQAEGLNFIIKHVKKMCKNPPLFNAITSFAGVRAYCDRHDFIIEKSEVNGNFINCAGIESPGLTASPAIAEYVVNELIGSLIDLKPNKNFNGVRTPDYFFNRLSNDEKNKIIKTNPAYGRIVCRCEKITEGEIIAAINQNPPASDIDGIKRRTRAGMGRCQGGFCQPHVAEIIARERGINLKDVTKSGKGSYIVTGEVK